jgi:hypothetical protein
MTEVISELKPGDRMKDGTIYSGLSPDRGQPMYTTPGDAPIMKWKQAMDYGAELEAHGHTDWRVPTKAELNALWENRDKGALEGTFDVTGSPPAGWYWSSTEVNDDDARGQRFSDGRQASGDKKNYDSSLRCVRG